MAREGYTSLTDVRRFLSGLTDGKNSKVYLKVNQRKGHNYLDVYVDNNYPDGEEAKYNGFHHMYQLEMNEVETPSV
jgi:hypothetical protein